ncbi:hypothetical protein [Dokdonia sp.]|uniref:hypothetical protein n=1 Tax=Dokdonia sp. TaxID=2024995 RepID=UPI003264531F
MENFLNIEFVYICMKYFVLVGISISTIELLYNWKNFKDDRLYSWKVISTRGYFSEKNTLHKLANFLLKYPNFIGVIILRLIIILLLVVPGIWGFSQAPLFLALVLTSLMINYRSPFGQDGSDQMSTIVIIVLFLYHINPENSIVAQAGIWFIALQSLLSYFTAGFFKAKGEKWTTRPNAVFLIFNTATYGSKPIAGYLQNRQMAITFLTWSTVAVEAAFPLVLVTGYPGMIVFLGWGLTFHLMNALVMGLNSFLWAFLATYGAIIYCCLQLSGYWIL